MELLSTTINFTRLFIVLGLIAILAIVLVVAILIVTKVCHIKEDEKLTKVIENLAGANCGACGYSGCEGYAKGLCKGEANLGACKATSNKNKEVIANTLGLEFTKDNPTVAVVKCNGGEGAFNKYIYTGNSDCISAMTLHGGDKICTTGCLGHGACVSVCPTGAISINKQGIAEVDRSICISCGACLKICPKHTIERVPLNSKVYVACNTKCFGRDVSSQCENGCIGCGLCARVCKEKAITMVDHLPSIDYSKCTACKTCVEKCPKHVIKGL